VAGHCSWQNGQLRAKAGTVKLAPAGWEGLLKLAFKKPIQINNLKSQPFGWLLFGGISR
jgi:hypothetical protein